MHDFNTYILRNLFRLLRYAGINALNAAAKYLAHGSRVVVVDRNRRWGGQWIDQYE